MGGPGPVEVGDGNLDKAKTTPEDHKQRLRAARAPGGGDGAAHHHSTLSMQRAAAPDAGVIRA